MRCGVWEPATNGRRGSKGKKKPLNTVLTIRIRVLEVVKEGPKL